MTPEDVVRQNVAAYLRQDRAACEALLGDDLTFTSPQDDHIDRQAFLDNCFPTAERVSRQDLIHVTPANDRDVFVLYEYDLKAGGTHRNTELITVVDEKIVERTTTGIGLLWRCSCIHHARSRLPPSLFTAGSDVDRSSAT